MQSPLMQFFGPESNFTVREALIQAGRQDLIGGCEGFIPANPPKEAIAARRPQANWASQGEDDNDHYHTVANPAEGEKACERGRTTEDWLPPRPEVSRAATRNEERWTE